MQYLKRITIKDNTYPGAHVLKKGFEFECSDINLFVGDQGCGKSTLLKLIQENHSDINLTMSEDVIKHGVNTYYFDSEKDNPRIKDPMLFTKPSGVDVGIGYVGAVASRFKSHGEVLAKYSVSAILKAKDCVVLLDEPESGLSITNQLKLIDSIKIAVSNNCQFFIATHCYPLIKAYNVISLEHNALMTGIDFINAISTKILDTTTNDS